MKINQLIIICLLLLPLTPAVAFDAAALRQQVLDQVVADSTARYPDADITVELAAFHAAVKDKACTKFDLALKGARLYGRVPVMARCSAPQPWTFYVTAQVDVAIEVVVANNSISKGQRITADLLGSRRISMTNLRRQYVQNPADATGKVAKRPIPSGQTLYISQLQTPLAVKKGQRIAILARIGSTYVSTHGTALQSGHIGEQITVRNESSQRLIRPWVTSAGTVSTRPPVPGGAGPAGR